MALAAGVLAGCSPPAAPRPPTRPGSAVGLPPIPLTSSTVGSTTWATLAMGHLDDPLNTFWQLVALSGGSPWELATPPGVASNGGLVAAAGMTSVLAGFEPTNALRFSPLARSTDQGSTWSPGILPAGMAPVPEALAENGDGHSLALLRTSAGTVLGNDGDLSTWTSVTSANALAPLPGPRGCHLTGLTAVAFDGAGTPLVGASCSRGGQAGIFAPDPHRMGVGGAGHPRWWQRTHRGDPPGPDADGHRRPGGCRRRGQARVVAMWSTNGLRTWTVSAGLPLDGGVLLSTGTTGGGGFVVATKGTDGSRSASDIAASGAEWQSLAPLPTGTTSVTGTPEGGYDALVSQQSTLVVYALAGTGWGRIQSLPVPIQYGSSG